MNGDGVCLGESSEGGSTELDVVDLTGTLDDDDCTMLPNVQRIHPHTQALTQRVCLRFTLVAISPSPAAASVQSLPRSAKS